MKLNKKLNDNLIKFKQGSQKFETSKILLKLNFFSNQLQRSKAVLTKPQQRLKNFFFKFIPEKLHKLI